MVQISQIAYPQLGSMSLSHGSLFIAEPPPNNELDRIETGLREMAHAILRDKGTILIHCSAGIHRTGMITNTLLLYLGLRQDEALEKLAQARQVTADGVGQKRLDWGQVFIDAKGTYNK